VRWRVLYRADGLHAVSPSTVTALGHLGWRTVLDLRTVDEVSVASYRCDGVDIVHLPVLRRTWDELGLEVLTDPVDFLVTRYLEMLEEGLVAIATAIEIVASPERAPLVFHCAAGKDRTGVLAAVILSLLGVSDADVAEDYGLSADAMARRALWQRSRPELAPPAGQPEAFQACPPEVMLTFLQRVRSRFGSVEEYVVDAGVPQVTIERLRDVLLQP
jgi:hypothetical protein